jgi:hypothetical protein
MLSWLQLARLNDSELGQIDLADVHLACAEGLPGFYPSDVSLALEGLAYFARKVAEETERFLPHFRRQPSAFRNSEAFFRLLCLVTVLQRDFGIHSDPELVGERFFKDSQHLFIHGIFRGLGGTCSSLPVLYAAVGRRLGYPLRLARTAHHQFARWDEPGGERLNLECTVLGLDSPPDEYYLTWPVRVDPLEAKAGLYLETKTPRKELAGFLVQRAYCLAEHARFREAVEAVVWACVAEPACVLHECSAVRILAKWHSNLFSKKPPLFPDVKVHAGPRRYPERIPYAIERRILWLGTIDRLLNDPDLEQKFWQPLRFCTGVWPKGIPTRIDVTPMGPEVSTWRTHS